MTMCNTATDSARTTKPTEEHNMNRTARTAVTAVVTLILLAIAWPATATGDDYPDTEVTVCWQMDNPDMSSTTSIEWPQTRLAACPTNTQACEGSKYQRDVYWLRDQGDEDYLAGLSTLAGPEDDAQLEPHDYGVGYIMANADLCKPPAHVAHAKVTLRKIANCNPRLSHVWLQDRKHLAAGHVTRTGPQTWRAFARAAKGHTFRDGSTFKLWPRISTRPANGCTHHGS